MQIDYLNLVLRLLHILAAATAIGGMVMWRFVLVPELHGATDATRSELREKFRKRWAMIVHICITFLLLSGLVNYVLFIQTYKAWGELWQDFFRKTYNMLFGIKFSVAMAVFFISSVLAGRSSGTQKFRDNAKHWLNVNLILVLAIVVLSGIMRQTHIGPSEGANYKVELKATEAK